MNVVHEGEFPECLASFTGFSISLSELQRCTVLTLEFWKGFKELCDTFSLEIVTVQGCVRLQPVSRALELHVDILSTLL